MRKLLRQHPEGFNDLLILMLKIYSYKLKTIIVLIANLLAINTFGQTLKQDSLHLLRDNRILNTFVLSTNPATLSQKIYPQYGYVNVGANSLIGNFRRPMEANSTFQINVETGGFKVLKGWAYNVFFNYHKQFDHDLAWSGIANAYEGNPFVWADSSVGNWERDHIKTSINVATPIVFKKLRAGLTLNYEVGSGARLSEPKPFYRQRYLTLQPGVTWTLSQKKTIGIGGKINFLQEENELGFFGNSNVLLYRLRGFGTFSKAPFVSGERKRKGADLQTNVHYHHYHNDYELFISAFAAHREEEVIEGVAIQQPTGYFTEIKYGGNTVLQKGNTQNGKSVTIAYQLKNGYADDVIFRAESASYSEHILNVNLSVWNTKLLKKTLLHFTLSPALRTTDYTDHATLTKFMATNLGSSLKVNWRKQLLPNVNLQLQPQLGYFHVISNSFINQRPNVITQSLILPDYNFFASSFTQFGGFAVLEVNQPMAGILHTFSFLNVNRFVVNNPFFSNRNNVQINYSIIF